MEKPYQGRAILNETAGGLEISVPTKKNWFLIIFLGAWLGGWTMGEIFALTAVASDSFGPGRLFVGFWLIAWTAGGFFAIRTWIWNVMGNELITFGQGLLTIDKKGALLYRAKTYDLNETMNFRAQEDDSYSSGLWGRRRNNAWSLGTGGTIRFDYGMGTVKFAAGIDEAEARSILNRLKDKRILTDKNFTTGK